MTSVSFDFGTLRTLRLALANLVEDLERAQYDFQGSLGYSDIGEIVSLITQDHRQVAIDRALRYADDLLDGLRGSIANVAAIGGKIFTFVDTYLAYAEVTEGMSPEGIYSGMSSQELYGAMQAELVLSHGVGASTSTFLKPYSFANDYVVRWSESETDLTFGPAGASSSYVLDYMASGNIEVVVTSEGQAGVGNGKAEIGGQVTTSTTYEVDPSQLPSFLKALHGSPQKFLPGHASTQLPTSQINYGSRTFPLAVKADTAGPNIAADEIGSTTSVAAYAQASESGKIGIPGVIEGNQTAQIQMSAGVSQSTGFDGTGSSDVYAQVNVSASGAIYILDRKFNAHGSVDASVTASLLQSGGHTSGVIDGEIRAEGYVMVGDKRYPPSGDFNAVDITFHAAINPGMPGALLKDISSGHLRSADLTNLVSEAGSGTYTVSYGNETVSTKNFMDIASTTSTQSFWQDVHTENFAF